MASVHTIETDLGEFVRGCLAREMRPSDALELWRHLGGRIRRQEFWELWLREKTARDAWLRGGAA